MHGLDAEEISGNKDGAVLCVIDGEAEHTPQTVKHFLAPFLKGMNQHFGICFGIEPVAALNQLFTQFLIVVDFTVESEYQTFILVIDRLVSLFKVNDAQTTKAHGNMVVLIIAHAVGATVCNDICHIFKHQITVFDRSGKSA